MPTPRSTRTTPMTPVRLRQIRALFEEALERAPADRAAFVAAASQDDVELRQEVEALLHALEQSDERLERPAVASLPRLMAAVSDPVAGRKVGRYDLVRHIGSGGMGAVYEGARADDEFHKRVALKLLRRGIESEHAVRRFRYERQILASLDHPNIAGLLDGGVTDDGQPYFVMEYVEGEPLLEYCDTRHLPTRARVTLFRQVCAAVQYAHQKLIVHRDLKPSNIMVTADGTVKLLDFGIAKLLGEEEQPDSVPLTRGGGRVLTPEYASPEQIRGLPIGTGSDVYSLGVMLYELLAGARPFELEGRLLHEIERIVCLRDPPAPSAQADPAAATLRGERNATRLRAHLAGDLDSIVLMALAKEPERRYASVEQLDADLERYLNGLPVHAQRDRLSYRVGKFVRRRRVEVGAAALVLVTLLGGIIVASNHARAAEAARVRAQTRYLEGRRLANALVFELHDAIADLPGATPVRAALVRRALEYLDGAAVDAVSPSLDLEMALAYQRVGDVQGNPTNANLGDLAGAHATYRKALGVAMRALAARPEDPVARRTLALTHERLADVLAPQGDVEGAVEHQRAALALYAALATAQPDVPDAAHVLAVSKLKLGDLLGHPAFAGLGERAAALTQYREALALLESLSARTADPHLNLRYRAVLLERIGRLEQEDGQTRRGLATLQASLALRETLRAERLLSVEARRDVAITHFLICDVHLELDDVQAAQESCDRSWTIRRALYDQDPSNVQLVRGMALIHRRLGHVMERAGRTAAALQNLRQSLSFYDDLLDEGHGTDADESDRRATRAELERLLRRATPPTSS